MSNKKQNSDHVQDANHLDHPLSQYFDDLWGDDRSGALGLAKQLLPATRAILASPFGTEGDRIEMSDHLLAVHNSLEAFAIQKATTK